MSLAWHIVLERAIPGVETFVNGKAMAHAGGLLDSLAVDAGVFPLSSFFSASAEEMTGFAADHGVDLNDLGTVASEEWFSPQDGLKTLAALVEVAQTRKMDELILEDLKTFQKVLSSPGKWSPVAPCHRLLNSFARARFNVRYLSRELFFERFVIRRILRSNKSISGGYQI